MRCPPTFSMVSALCLGGLLSLAVTGCGGSNNNGGGGDCETACGVVANRCGGNTGAIGLAPGGCLGACSQLPLGGAGLTLCAGSAGNCDAAQACFPQTNSDGGLPFQFDLSHPNDMMS